MAFASYIVVNILGLFGYLLLILLLLRLSGDERVRRLNGILLLFFLWTLGSLLMRMNAAPSYQFWYHVSLSALMLLAHSLCAFALSFLQEKISKTETIIWRAVSLLLVVAVWLDLVVPAPEQEFIANGEMVFHYHAGWPLIAVCLYLLGMFIRVITLGVRAVQKKQLRAKWLWLYVSMVVLLLLGNLISVLPGNIFPWDILSGLVVAVMLIGLLHQDRLFGFSALLTPSGLMELSLFASMAITALEISLHGELLINAQQNMFGGGFYLTSAVALVQAGILYCMMYLFFGQLSMNEAQVRAERMRETTRQVLESHNLQELKRYTEEYLRQTVQPEAILGCFLQRDEKTFRLSAEDEQLDVYPADSAFLKALEGQMTAVTLRKLHRTRPGFWDEAPNAFRYLLDKYHIRCVMPFMMGEKLTGFLLLGRKSGLLGYTQADLDNISSVGHLAMLATANLMKNRRLYHEARTDSLTGLHNRFSFHEHLPQAMKETSGILCAFLLDDFRLYNELYGTVAGDHALLATAGELRAALAERDAFLCRYSGKEFMVLLPGGTRQDVQELMERLDKSQQAQSGILPLAPITYSAGACTWPTPAATDTELIYQVNLALTRARQLRSTKLVIYDNTAVTDDASAEDSFAEISATIYALTAAIDAKDHYTFGHSENVSHYAKALATEVGMTPGEVRMITQAGLLHDIGKIGIQESILSKPTRLNAEEYEIMKEHVQRAIGILRHLPNMDAMIPMVMTHHERWDGKGYPRGMKGSQIPLGGRCLAVVDAFDAMVSRRSYKEKMPVEYAVKELRENAGTQFDPLLAMVFAKLVEDGKVEVQTDDQPRAAG